MNPKRRSSVNKIVHTFVTPLTNAVTFVPPLPNDDPFVPPLPPCAPPPEPPPSSPPSQLYVPVLHPNPAPNCFNIHKLKSELATGSLCPMAVVTTAIQQNVDWYFATLSLLNGFANFQPTDYKSIYDEMSRSAANVADIFKVYKDFKQQNAKAIDIQRLRPIHPNDPRKKINRGPKGLDSEIAHLAEGGRPLISYDDLITPEASFDVDENGKRQKSIDLNQFDKNRQFISLYTRRQPSRCKIRK